MTKNVLVMAMELAVVASVLVMMDLSAQLAKQIFVVETDNSKTMSVFVMMDSLVNFVK